MAGPAMEVKVSLVQMCVVTRRVKEKGSEQRTLYCCTFACVSADLQPVLSSAFEISSTKSFLWNMGDFISKRPWCHPQSACVVRGAHPQGAV